VSPRLKDFQDISKMTVQASFVVVPTGTGRPRGSHVWKYFSYHAAEDVR
jgi:hypothetical protein